MRVKEWIEMKIDKGRKEEWKERRIEGGRKGGREVGREEKFGTV